MKELSGVENWTERSEQSELSEMSFKTKSKIEVIDLKKIEFSCERRAI